jgi:hypothetical protein
MSRIPTARIALALAAVASIHQAQTPAKNPPQPKLAEASLAVEPDCRCASASAD